jgi:hypothetical protein
MSRGSEEEKDNGCRNTSDGEVDVETPPPGNVIGESTSQQRADDTTETICGTQDAGESRSLLGRGGKSYDGVGTSAEAGGTNASNRSASNESVGARCSAANRRANFKDEDGREERSL